MAIVFDNVTFSDKSIKLNSVETKREHDIVDKKDNQVDHPPVEQIVQHHHQETSFSPEKVIDGDALNERYKLELEVKYQQIYEEKLTAEKEKIELAIQEGYKQGYSKGTEDADSKINQDLEKKLENLISLHDVFHDALKTRLLGTENMFQQIIIESIYKVFGDILEDRTNVIAIINNVIKSISNSTILILRVSDTDFEYINSGHSPSIKGLNNPDIKIISDERVEMGGCIVETDIGTIDGRLETQLSHLKDIIKTSK